MIRMEEGRARRGRRMVGMKENANKDELEGWKLSLINNDDSRAFSCLRFVLLAFHFELIIS